MKPSPKADDTGCPECGVLPIRMHLSQCESDEARHNRWLRQLPLAEVAEAAMNSNKEQE